MTYGRNPQRSPEDVNSSGKDWLALFTVFKRAGTGLSQIFPDARQAARTILAQF